MEDSVSVSKIHILHQQPEPFREAIATRLPGRSLVGLETHEAFADSIDEAEVLVAFRPPRGLWKQAKRLRLIQMTGAGVDALLPAPDLSPGVRIANARGIHGEYMSEFALAMILAFEKRIPLWIDEQRSHRWKRHRIDLVREKTVVILGLGTIGREIARVCRALGMRVTGTKQHPTRVENVSRVEPPSETKALFEEADYVVIVLPLTPETRGSIDAALLDALPRAAVVINLARGGIVDETALKERLEAGRLRGAALDVFEEEPLPESSPLWDTPNTILTPHLSGWFAGYADRLADILVHNVLALERGTPLRNEIDRERGY